MKGKAIFIAGPTGVGKTTTVHLLKERHPEFIYAPSYTTRLMRPGETQGDPYFFISDQEFKDKINSDLMLEYALVHNAYYYGTPTQSITTPVDEGKIVYKEIEIQGYLQLKQKLDKSYFTGIFLYPSEPEIIKQRILKRQPDMSTNEIQQRLKSFDNEMNHIDEFEYKIETIENGEEIIYKKVLEVFEKYVK